ncbi:MAG TPA: hypothetical protein VN793_05480 [Acidimicrobiales bacterium]|nr:hypothetical protein [Acidimicrobiales bacterium]
MPHPLDEYPIHQAAVSMQFPATGDRGFYDRCYFNAHDRTGSIFLITGLGVYPNLGVTDAYASVGRGNRLVSIHASDALGDDRLNQKVGPYRIEVLEPLQRIRLICDADDLGVGFDLTWDGSFPALQEPQHVVRNGNKLMLDGCRFTQVGTWSGELRVEGQRIPVSPDTWVGARDRSWGLRPVGEPEPPGRWAAENVRGMWWLYVPLRFEDYGVIVIVQEEADGTRVLNDARRVWPAASGRAPEQLGWPEIDITYRSGTRHPERAVIHLTDRNRKPIEIEIETLGSIALGPGTGYGGQEWTHGRWMGRGWTEGVVHDWSDPALAAGKPLMLHDHVARASLDGAEGWGLFEHASIGRHDPTGFADFTALAP